MKKQNVILLLLLLTSCNFFVACGNRGTIGTELNFDSLQLNETTYLLADTANPACNLVLNVAYVTQASDSSLKDTLNYRFLSAVLGPQYAKLTPQEAVSLYARQYAADYKKDVEAQYQQDLENSKKDGTPVGAWYSYYRGAEGHLQWQGDRVLVYRVDHNEYTGGAHGIYSSMFLNIDMHTLKPLGLDDFFVPDAEVALTDLLWNQLQMDNHVTSRAELEELGYGMTGDLVPTSNFYVSPEGMTFFYNVYEIAPYAMGPVIISLPYASFKHLLDVDSPLVKALWN